MNLETTHRMPLKRKSRTEIFWFKANVENTNNQSVNVSKSTMRFIC